MNTLRGCDRHQSVRLSIEVSRGSAIGVHAGRAGELTQGDTNRVRVLLPY
jgi:hypothetical protein